MNVPTNSLQAWLLASRPKTLTAALIPILPGAALAGRDGHFGLVPVLLCALFACLMQVAANFINDLYDYRKGTDREDRLGPERACAQGWITPRAMTGGILTVITLACLTGCTLLGMCWEHLPYHGWELVALGALCVVFAFLYTTRLSYWGWGDLLVVVFFGFVPTGGTYYVQAYALTADVAIASLVCGLAIDTLLVVNNYRDREQDAISGKHTLIVRLGEPFGRYMYLALGIAATLLSLWMVRGNGAIALLLPLVYLALHILTWRKMARIRSGKKLNSILGETSRNMLFLGILLSMAILL